MHTSQFPGAGRCTRGSGHVQLCPGTTVISLYLTVEASGALRGAWRVDQLISLKAGYTCGVWPFGADRLQNPFLCMLTLRRGIRGDACTSTL